MSELDAAASGGMYVDAVRAELLKIALDGERLDAVKVFEVCVCAGGAAGQAEPENFYLTLEFILKVKHTNNE